MLDSSKSTLAERLRAARNKCSLSQKALAERLDIHELTYVKYEAGEREPKASVLAMFISETGVDGHWLLTGNGEMIVNDRRLPKNREEILDNFLAAYMPGLPPDEWLTLKSIIIEAEDPVMRSELKTQTILIKAGPFREYFEKKERERKDKILKINGG